MISNQTKEIQALVNDVRDGRLLLPELQRSFVWKSTQVRDLFDSLYHQYPSGQLLVWETDDLPYSHGISVEGVVAGQRKPHLLLDGQQRMTSLAAVMLGKPLIVRGSTRPIDIVFNVYSEKFEVAGLRYTVNGGWVSLKRLFTQGVLDILKELNIDTAAPNANQVFARLQRLENIKTYKYQVNILESLTYDEVTHIFVRINSGGTKLNSADLALAQMSSRWRGVTEEITKYQKYVANRGNRLEIETGILIRAMSAILIGQTRLSLLFRGERQKLTLEDLQLAWECVKNGMNQATDFLVNNCGMDRLDMLPTQYILIPLTVFFDKYGGRVSDEQARQLERWVYMALIWNRYSGASETAADQDISAVKSEDPTKNLIQNIEDKIGSNRSVTERDLQDQRRNSPFMLISYILARKANATDWFNGVLIHGNRSLEIHTIFPKDLLREKYDLRAQSHLIDQVANLVFLSKRVEAKIKNHSPEQYLPDISEHRLYSQFIPLDRNLWKLTAFEDFLNARRQMLAKATNQMLRSLSDSSSIWVTSAEKDLENRIHTIESKFRILVAIRLEEAYHAEAWGHIPSTIQNNLQQRIASHIVKHPYQANNFQTLDARLDFCQFSDYAKIITSNWNLFVDDFGTPSVFSMHIQNVTDLRNNLMHGREAIADHALATGEGGLLWLEKCLAKSLAVIQGDADSEDGSNEF